MADLISEQQKGEAVDKWLSDVAEAASALEHAREAESASRSIVESLEAIESRVRGVSPDLQARMAEAVAGNLANAERYARAAARYADVEASFYEVTRHMGGVAPRAWRMRYIEGDTWQRCARRLHYSRQHLERVCKEAKPQAYNLLPEAYRIGGGA